MPPTLICRICLDALHDKRIVATKCGHMFCSDCAGAAFARTRASCPVCRKPQSYGQLIRLFPEWEPSENSTPAPPVPAVKTTTKAAYCYNYPYPSSTATHAYHHSLAIAAYYQPPPPQPAPPTLPAQPILDTYVPLNNQPFPWARAGEVPAWDLDGTPVYVGIALFNGGWHPCKIAPYSASPCARVSYGGKEHAHAGMCHLLPFDPARMEWVPASRGHVPHGRRPVEGGYEEIGGDMLYHALAVVGGVKVPGKAGAHLASGASVPYGNVEHIVRHYEILCWRDYY